MKDTLACSCKKFVWFWLNTDSWTGGDARYWFFPPLHLSSFTCLPFQRRVTAGSFTQCIPTFLPMVFALTRWQDNVAPPDPKIRKKNQKPPFSLLQMLVRNWNSFHYLHVHTSKIQATSRFYFTPQKKQSPNEAKYECWNMKQGDREEASRELRAGTAKALNRSYWIQ